MKMKVKKNKSEMPNLVELPPEIIEQDILPRLPVKSILLFRCVSKSWCELFRNPCFIRNQLLQSNNNPKLMLVYIKQMLSRPSRGGGIVYSLEYGKKYHRHNVVEISHSPSRRQRIWGSCDGLVCLENLDFIHFMYLWNPSTREFKVVPDNDSPQPHTNGECQRLCTTYGFGYNDIAKDYEIVEINAYCNFFDQTIFSRFSIYSLRKNSWEAHKDMAPYIVETTTKGVLVNDALHWVGYKFKSVIAFDLGDRKFRQLPMPTHDDEHEYLHLRVINVVSLNKCLSIGAEYNQGIEAWMMKDYGVKESWTKVIKVITPYFTYGEQHSILDCFAMSIATQKMVFHDLHTYTLDEFLDKLGGGYHNIKEVIAQSYSSTLYTESLVPLQGYDN